MERVPGAVTVFIAPPSLGELEERLRRRDTETGETIERRMEHARDEMDELAREYLLVALAVGELQEGIVDAYYGPVELHQQAVGRSGHPRPVAARR